MADIPTFFLYGEPARDTAADFLHVEPLDTRSRAAHWHIRPHRHAALHHVFLLTTGAVVMRLPAQAVPAQAPCVLTIPAGTPHAFDYVAGTTGRVLTLSRALAERLAAVEPAVCGVFAAPAACGAGDDASWIMGNLDRLAHELAWRPPGYDAAARVALLSVLVAVCRLSSRAATASPARAAQDDLVARFRELIEAHFHAHRTVAAYASLLGVSESRLRMACRDVARASPLALIQHRQIAEAKSALLHGHMRIGDIAAHLGYDDPAYFARLFKRREGATPRSFRDATQKGPLL